MIAIFRSVAYNKLYFDRRVFMKKTWVVYILECKDGTYYTGITDDLGQRIAKHTSGQGAKYTRGRGPFLLRYCAEMESKSLALKEELRIKNLTRQEKTALCSTYLKSREESL